ncbi:MAG: creatininase family protein [Candidatus Hydrothermarchaeota archaeon]
MKGYLLEHLTWRDTESLLPNKVVLIPIGATEEHGYHLPLGTDTTIVSEIAKKLAEEIDVIVAPTISYGNSLSLMDWSGTVSLEPETIIKMLEDTMMSLIKHGVKKIIFLNGHGGNTSAIKIAGKRVNSKTGAKIILINWWELIEERIKEVCEKEGLHAGEAETSLMLALRSDLVRSRDMKEEQRTLKKIKKIHILEKFHIEDIPSGTIGDPSLASEKKGKILLETIIKEVKRIIKDF